MQAKTNLGMEDTSVGDEVLGKKSLIVEENEENENGGGFGDDTAERRGEGDRRERDERGLGLCV